MLKYEGDVEDTFMQTFQLSHHDVFGNVLTFNLKPDGDQIPVTNQNRQVQTPERHCLILLSYIRIEA